MIAVSFVASACGGDLRVPEVILTDSAGIEIRTLSALPSWTSEAHRWELVPERTIPTATAAYDEEPLLYQPQGYARLADGTLVVLDGGERRIAIVDAKQNDVLRRFGPSGQGPGEILSSNSIIWPAEGTTFWVLDPGNQRLSRFDVEGGLQEERRVDIPGLGGVAFQNPLTHRPWFWKIFVADIDDRTLTDSIGRLTEDATRVDFVAPLPERAPSRRRAVDDRLLFTGNSWFAPIGVGGVVAGRSDAGRFLRYDSDGRLLAFIDVPMEPTEIPEAEKPSILEEYVELVGAGGTLTIANVGDAFPLYNLMWALEDSLFALQQMQWSTPAGEPRIPPDQMVWRTFSITGSYEGAIVLPTGVAQPYWVEPGRIIATKRDSLGIATIVSYRLVRPDR